MRACVRACARARACAGGAWRGAGLSSKPIQVLRTATAATGAAVESTRKASFSRLTPHASASGRSVGPTMRMDE